MSDPSKEELIGRLQQMDPYKFEQLVAKIWEIYGYTTDVKSGSHDQGVDIEAIKETPYSQKDLIQAKRYAEGNNLGSDQIRNYATLYRQFADVDVVVIVTTSKFTTEAEALAENLNVKTVDQDNVYQLISQNHSDLNNILPMSNVESSQNRSKRDRSSLPVGLSKGRKVTVASEKYTGQATIIRRDRATGRIAVKIGNDVKLISLENIER